MRLFADGGELTVLRSLAAFAYGAWSVSWPEAVPEEQRPGLPDDRNFGYVSRMSAEPGRMGRRFVRDDVSIEAFEPGVDGARLPDTGFSDVEETLDAAARRTTGDTFFEFEFTREHLGALTPYVDFNVGDLVTVVIWGRSLVVPVVSIDTVTDQGAVVDWRVRVGGTLVGDRAELDRSYREIRRDLLQEQRERRDAVAEARAHTDSAVAGERSERVSDVDSVRVVLGGAQASEESLVSQLAAVQAQITGMVGDDETPPPAGLLNSYLWMNMQLWEQQQDINSLNSKFQEEVRARQRDQAVLDARQDTQAKQIALAVPRIASIKEGENESAENDFFRMYIDGPATPASTTGDWLYAVELKRGWEGTLIMFVRSDTVPMNVSAWRVTERNGLVQDGSPLLDSNGVVHYTASIKFKWPRTGFSLVAIGVANPPV